LLKYILKRIFVFIPTLIVISLLAFVISLNSPTDPVERLVNSAVNESDLSSESSASEELRQEVRKKLGLDLPVFYINLSSLAESDTLYRIAERSHQENLSKLTKLYGNWSEIQAYYSSLKNLEKAVGQFKADSSLNATYSSNKLTTYKNKSILGAKSLFELNDDNKIIEQISVLDTLYQLRLFSSLNPILKSVKLKYSKIKRNTTNWKNYIPTIQFNGFLNQYHLWLFGDSDRNRGGVIRGDFGKSYIDNKSVGDKMLEMFPYSFFLVIISIILAYLISIPLGIYSAYKKDTLFDNVVSVLVFMLYSLPSFFVATWLLYQFSNPDNLLWFPSNGVKNPATYNNDWSWYDMDSIKHQAPYFVLPIIAFTYSSFAFTNRIMRVSMIDVLGADYIRTARAKGLSERHVILKHGLRNGLLPIITMFSNVFPAAIGGSVILETIFGIPGMGGAVYEAILGIDIPMIVAVFTLTGALTVTGYLISDVLYAIVDPRISYSKK
jgi:peptide/nickel transport system permease protein